MIWGNRELYQGENFTFDNSGIEKTEKLLGNLGRIWIEEFRDACECQLKNSF